MSSVDGFRLKTRFRANQGWAAKVGVLVAALVLTLVSSKLEWTGPELARFGNLCGASHDDPCMRQRLNGGFPLAYLFDAPGVSVEGKLSFGEDEFRVAPFVFDLAVYVAIILLAAAAFRLHRSCHIALDDFPFDSRATTGRRSDIGS